MRRSPPHRPRAIRRFPIDLWQTRPLRGARLSRAPLKEIAMQNDTRIRQRVLDELDFNPSFTADGIGVAVKDGIVTLSGYVPSYVQKVAVEEAVQRVPGVRAVAEDMAVRLPDDHRHDDDEIARRAADIFGWT